MNIFKRITALLLAVVMCLSYIPAHAHAATLEDLFAIDGAVTLDGTNDGTVTVAISTPDTIGLYAIIGNWSLTETAGSNYLTLTEIGSDKMTFTGDNSVTVEDGEVWYIDDNFNTEFEANDRILYATYSVAADTPEGVYTVTFDPYSGIIDVHVNEYYDPFTFTITVSVEEAGCGCSPLNPHQLTPPFIQIGDESFDHHYTWTATADGTLHFECNDNGYWNVNVNGGEEEYVCDEGVNSIPVSKDDVLRINLYHASNNTDVAASWSVTFEESNPVVPAQKYDITWVDGDGNELYTQEVEAGTVPEYEYATPTKTENDEYRYEFKEWSPAPYAADKDQTYTAQFNAIKKTYEITWIVNGNSSVKEYAYGVKPSYPGLLPPCATIQWDEPIVVVTGPATYTGTVKEEHDFTVEVEGSRTDATCTTAGSVTFNCKDCYEQETRVLEIDPDAHTYVDGYCVCEKAKTLPVIVDREDYQQDVTFTLSNPTATFGQDFVATVTADKGTGIDFTGTNALKQYCTFDKETNTLTIPAKAITADMETINVHFMATVLLTTDLNGGVMSEDYKQGLQSQGAVINGDKITMPAPYGRTGKLNALPDFLVSNAGHTNNGQKDQNGTYYANGAEVTFRDDVTLTFQWKCNSGDNLTHHAAVPATCTEGGTIEYWQCTCDKLYSDANATTEVTEDKLATSAAGHTFGETVAAKDSTCVAAGNVAYKQCTACELYFAADAETNSADGVKDAAGFATEMDSENHAGEKKCNFDDESTHDAFCDACKNPWDPTSLREPHTANENGYCVCGAFAVVEDFNGGMISPNPPAENITPEEWQNIVNNMYGGFDATNVTTFNSEAFFVEIDEYALRNMNALVVKEGYHIVGLAYDAGGTRPYKGEDITEPTTLYFVWEEMHICAHDHYKYTQETHQSICECGEPVGEPVNHSMADDGICECGACVVNMYVLYADVTSHGYSNESEREEPWFYPVAYPNEDLVITAKSDFSTCVMIDAYYFDDTGAGQSWDGKLTIPADKVNENLYIDIIACTDMKVILNGGITTPEFEEYAKAWNLTVGEGYYVEPIWYNSACFITITDLVEKPGHTISHLVDQDGKEYMVDEDGEVCIDATTKPLELTIVWTCDTLTYVEAKEEVHTVNTLEAGVAAHYECSCGKYFDENKVETTLDALTGDLPQHAHKYYDDDATHHWSVCECGYQLSEKTNHVYNPTTHMCVCDRIEEFTFTWDFAGGKLDGKSEVEPGTCQYNRFFSISTSYTDEFPLVKEGYTFLHFVDQDGNEYVPERSDFMAEVYTSWYIGTMPAKDLTLTAVWKCDHATTKAVDNEDGKTHNLVCANEACNGHVVTKNVPHTYNETTHECDCGAVKTFTLIIQAIDLRNGETDPLNDVIEREVPYGARVADYIKPTMDGITVHQPGDNVPVNGKSYQGSYAITGWKEGSTELDLETFTMPAEEVRIEHAFVFTGWMNQFNDVTTDETPIGTSYRQDGEMLEGWHEIDGSWYCFVYDEAWDDWFRAEGLTRVPYPTGTIEGNTYKPDEEAMTHHENFIDAEEAWFQFDQDGKFQYDVTTFISHGFQYLEKGMLAWHPGVVEDGTSGNYYYFTGDTEYGGNITAESTDVYVTRVTANNSNTISFVIGGVYTTDEYGKICKYHGITDMDNGTKRYYQNAQLMLGAGFLKVGENYIYVRHNGELVVNKKYWVPANEYGIPEGVYEFDSNGFLVLGDVDPVKNGIYFEKDGWFLYRDGVLARNSGLIQYQGDWYDADGKAVKKDSQWIYVRSNGQLAEGAYWVANVPASAPVKSGDLCVFDDYGVLQAAKNGIYEERGSLYYYENNLIKYSAGVVELDGNYYYVRSNGEVVHSKSYWITNVGQSGVIAGLYTFDDKGVMQNPRFEVKSGIIDGYYYVNDSIAYGAGLVKLEDEKGEFYIYVRSSGELATGVYWPTTTNGYDVSGRLDFGTDGKCYL